MRWHHTRGIVCITAALLIGLCGCGADDEEAAAVPGPQDSVTEAPEGEASTPQRQRSAGSVADRVEDAKLETRVALALADDRQLRSHRFNVDAADGRVRLSGNVPTNAAKSRAINLASEVSGVRDVIDQIESDEPAPASETVALSETGGENRQPENGEDDAQSASGEETYHTVRSGESLWTIARRYDTSVAELERLNDGIGGLKPGQRVRVQ